MKKITIGRNPDNDIVILDYAVSGAHAEIEIHDDGTMRYVDHSTNGTMVNGNHLHNDSCMVFGKDDIRLPGGHELDWSKVPVPVPQYVPPQHVAAPAPVQPQYAQPAPQPMPYPQQPSQQIEEITFVGVLKNFWKNYFNFSGRATRKEYWLMVVWNMIFSMTGIGLLVVLAGCIGYLSLTIRRLHDSGKSGWFLLLGCIPLIGQLIIFIFTVTDSDRNANKWGACRKNF